MSRRSSSSSQSSSGTPLSPRTPREMLQEIQTEFNNNNNNNNFITPRASRLRSPGVDLEIQNDNNICNICGLEIEPGYEVVNNNYSYHFLCLGTLPRRDIFGVNNLEANEDETETESEFDFPVESEDIMNENDDDDLSTIYIDEIMRSERNQPRRRRGPMRNTRRQDICDLCGNVIGYFDDVVRLNDGTRVHNRCFRRRRNNRFGNNKKTKKGRNGNGIEKKDKRLEYKRRKNIIQHKDFFRD
jgi:hypothetical protein